MTVTLLHILVAVHTLVAAVSTSCLVYLFLGAWKRRSPRKDLFLRFALAWPLLNWVLLLANSMECPMQSWAKDLAGVQDGWVRDLYLVPESWIAWVPWTYGSSYVIGTCLVFWRQKKRALSAPLRQAEAKLTPWRDGGGQNPEQACRPRIGSC